MNNLIMNKPIENMIYEINGKQVMLDSDLAKLYNVETKRINESVTRNLNKFPKRFSWELNQEEINNLRSQFATSSYNNNYGGRRYLPRVFTEQGVAMLATILKSNTAIEVSIKIMDAFVLMRRLISNSLLSNNIEHKLLDHDKRIILLEETFDNFKEQNNHIFFEGQIYDSYSLLIDIFNKSKEKIIIIDNYANKELLNIISKISSKVTIISSNMDEILINKYMSEYDNLKIIKNDSFHDRFIIIDNKTLYHCGASFKDLGKKCFAINKIEDKNYLELIMWEIWKK